MFIQALTRDTIEQVSYCTFSGLTQWKSMSRILNFGFPWISALFQGQKLLLRRWYPSPRKLKLYLYKFSREKSFCQDGTFYCCILFLTEIVACVSMDTLGFPAAIINEYKAISLVEIALGLTFHYNEGSWYSSKYNKTKCFLPIPNVY